MPAHPLSEELLREAVEAHRQHGTVTQAALALGLPRPTLQSRLAQAAVRGIAPGHFNQGTAPGFTIGKVTIQRGPSGEVERTWERQSPDDAQREEAIRSAIASLADEVRGLSPLTPAPAHTQSDLMAVYPMGDPHFGLYAYAEETGDNFDLDIAETVTRDAIDRLVQSAPPAETGMLVNLGDAFHADDSSNQTPTSGHALDVDTRFAKVAQIGLRAMVHCVHRLLEKHEKVIVWNMAGNHDPHSALWLAIAMDAFFANEPRVSVDLSPSLFKFLRFGKVLLGAHHGHGAKANDLPLLMAADRPEDWGATEFRHWLCGHIHHWTAKEHPGVVVETFRTLAGKDAWHAGKGYRSRRDMNCIVYHKQYGEIQRVRCDIAMLRQ